MLPLYQSNILTMVKRSDKDCRFEETSLEGAAGSSATTTAPGAPGVLESALVASSLYWSMSDIVAALDLTAIFGGQYLSTIKSQDQAFWSCDCGCSSVIEDGKMADFILLETKSDNSSLAHNYSFSLFSESLQANIRPHVSHPCLERVGKVEEKATTTAVLGFIRHSQRHATPNLIPPHSDTEPSQTRKATEITQIERNLLSTDFSTCSLGSLLYSTDLPFTSTSNASLQNFIMSLVYVEL